MFEPLHSWQGATTTRKEGAGSKEVCKLGVVRVRLNGISRRVRCRRKQPVQARFRTADIADVPFGNCVLHFVSSPFIADVVVPKKPISRDKYHENDWGSIDDTPSSWGMNDNWVTTNFDTDFEVEASVYLILVKEAIGDPITIQWIRVQYGE